jgi:hypothetical protein
MTSKYKISILLPTRGRTTALERSVKSLLDNATNKNDLQLLLGLDTDDTEGLTFFHKTLEPYLESQGIDYTAMSFSPMGYDRLNDYVNTLAKNSDADWLFFWNDDAVMESKGWDVEIASYTGEFKLLAVHTHNDHPYSIFPIVPREWLEVIGHLSLHSMNDAWLSQIAFLLDIWKRIEVTVTHDRADLTGNNKDSTYNNRILLEGNPLNPRDFHHPSYNNHRMNECDRLRDYMKERGLDTSFWDTVKAGKQDPWEKLKANDPNGQMKQFRTSEYLNGGL